MSELVNFDPTTRRMWMFPRNIREITPWKIYGVLKLLMQSDDMNQYSREDQKVIYQLLEEANIKKPSATRDKNPGGMRTYYAQLECLGLIFKTKDKKSYNYTIAGEAIAEENNPLQVLQYQLLRHQYPSAYGLSQNVKMDPRLKVKPFLFLLKLLHDERLEGYITNAETVFPVIYGHNKDCHEYVVNKILKYRECQDYNKTIDDWEFDLYTPRGSNKWELCISNALNIGNTALCYMTAVALLSKDTAKQKGLTKYIFNTNYEDLYQEFLATEDTFIPISSKDEYQSFQRAYGRYQKEKDNRSITDLKQKKESPELQFATFKYIEYINDNLFDDDPNIFVAEMQKYGISQHSAVEAIERINNRKISIQEQTYLEYAYSGGLQSEEFEKATTELLKSLGFINSQWIGRRKSYNNWRGNFPDIYIKKPNTVECGMADTKASAIYSLGHSDMLKLKDTYVHTNKEIEKDSVLKYFLYIAGGFKGEIETSLSQLSEATGIPVAAIDAKGMLRLKQLHDNGWSTEKIEQNIFFSTSYHSSDELQLLMYTLE